MTYANVPAGAPLTPREREALVYAADGLDVRETAKRMDITEGTVKEMRNRVRVKLRAKTMAQAVAHSYHAGIFKPAGRRVIQINRAQALGLFSLSQRVTLGDEVEFLDQGNMGEVYVRAGEYRYQLPRRGGFQALEEPRTIPAHDDPVHRPVSA